VVLTQGGAVGSDACRPMLGSTSTHGCVGKPRVVRDLLRPAGLVQRLRVVDRRDLRPPRHANPAAAGGRGAAVLRWAQRTRDRRGLVIPPLEQDGATGENPFGGRPSLARSHRLDRSRRARPWSRRPLPGRDHGEPPPRMGLDPATSPPRDASALPALGYMPFVRSMPRQHEQSLISAGPWQGQRRPGLCRSGELAPICDRPGRLMMTVATRPGLSRP
jgi:hypothetical protein